MSFFKNFKDDLSQAVNELGPKEMNNVSVLENSQKVSSERITDTEFKETIDNIANSNDYDNIDQDIFDSLLTQVENETINSTGASEEDKKNEKDKITGGTMDSYEVTIIAKGTTVNGDINSEGSLEIMGAINGDVECQGKLLIQGRITGNCSAAEVHALSERITGSIISESSIKIGQGATIIGDITATSGIIAGAIKGNIDINGTIIIDASAIIKGNIKAKSIQINEGAIIEGYCSLSYASVDLDSIFA